MRKFKLPKVVELKRKNNFKMYPTFSDMDCEVTKIWNRCATYFNVIKDISVDEATAYAKQFTVEDRQKMVYIFNQIKEKGYEQVRSSVNRMDFVFLTHPDNSRYDS